MLTCVGAYSMLQKVYSDIPIKRDKEVNINLLENQEREQRSHKRTM